MDTFWVRVIMSFFIGGIWLMMISVIAEKYGNKLAALLGGLPSTLLIALFFIGLNEGSTYAAKATIVTPAAFIIDAYFILMLAKLAMNGYFKALGLSSIFWFITIGGLVLMHLKSYAISLLIWSLGLMVLIGIINKILPVRNIILSSVEYTKKQLFIRALFAGTVISAAVIISHYSGPLIGGIFTAFPAAYLSTFTIFYYSRGLHFSEAFIKPLIISGSVNTVVYSLVVYYLYPRFGIYWGTLIAFGISLLSTFYLVRFLLNYLTARWS